MTPQCDRCGGPTRPERLKRHELGDLLGLESVQVSNLPAAVCTKCRAVLVAGPVLEFVERALALGIVEESKWSPAEVRYLRKFLGFTQAQLSDHLGVERITVGRWERGEVDIQGPAALALRGLVVLKVNVMDPRHPALGAAQRATLEPERRRAAAQHHRVDAAPVEAAA